MGPLEHLKWLYHYEIEKHADFDAVEGVEKNFKSEGIVCFHILKTMSHRRIKTLHDRYILRRWRRDAIRPHIRKFLQGGYLSMMNEYKKNCDVVLDNNAKYVDFNVLNSGLNVYSDWNDDMAIPNVGDLESDNYVTFITNSREINKNRSTRDASQEAESSQGRRGGGRRGGGRRAGRGCQGGGRIDLNIHVASNPTWDI
ncbi:hypothetical protein H5410_031995 [Solanum commersonii]|uniref:Protein FAR1-RELATED SEQUENCE n=1 Tax=Solanum commersonii TaxID=4109 RepID=A0A9J5YJW9_SOLCO|nr:hypothetical protein H5410_031995 [Solanum commersonii]